MSPREHIEQLAAQLRVGVIYNQPHYGESQYDSWDGVLMLAPWGSADESVLYGIALHELGHAAVGHSPTPFWIESDEVAEEAEASLWGYEFRRTDLGLDDATVVGTLAHSVGNRLDVYGVKRLTREIRELLQLVGPEYEYAAFEEHAGGASEGAHAWQQLYHELELARVA